jgi:trigger factor
MSSVEKLEGLSYRVVVEVPAEKVSQAYKQCLNKIAKSVDLKGFRKGKVPTHVVETQFRSRITQEVANQLLQSSFPELLQEHELAIAGNPQFDLDELVKDQSYSYKATFEVYPKVEVKPLDGQVIAKTVAEVEDQDLDTMISKLAAQKAVWSEVDCATEKGHRATIDFAGFIDDQPFEGGSSEGFVLELGSGQMIAGFEDGLTGLKVGDEKEVEVTFPEGYGVKDLAGKPAVFKIKLHKVEASELPTIDDDLAKELGFKEGLEAMKTSLRENMTRELQQVLRNRYKKNVLDKMLELNPIEVPNALVDGEIEHMQKMFLQQMAAQQGQKNLPDIDLPREPYEQEAIKRVKLGLLLAEVIKAAELKVDPDLVRERVEELAASYEQKEEIVKWYYSNDKMKAEIEASVLEDQAVDKLIENAKIEEVSLSYEEIMKSAEK